LIPFLSVFQVFRCLQATPSPSPIKQKAELNTEKTNDYTDFTEKA